MGYRPQLTIENVQAEPGGARRASSTMFSPSQTFRRKVTKYRVQVSLDGSLRAPNIDETRMPTKAVADRVDSGRGEDHIPRPRRMMGSSTGG